MTTCLPIKTKHLIALFLISATILTACGSTNKRTTHAGEAMAEISCILLTSEDILNFDGTEVNEILQKHGFENEEEMDAYLLSIEGTTELNEVAVSVRSHLEKTCGEELEALGLSAEDLYEDLVLE